MLKMILINYGIVLEGRYNIGQFFPVPIIKFLITKA